MDKISRFEKVSPEQFKKDWINCFSACPDKEIESIYNSIRLPKRATLYPGRQMEQDGHHIYQPGAYIVVPARALGRAGQPRAFPRHGVEDEPLHVLSPLPRHARPHGHGKAYIPHPLRRQMGPFNHPLPAPAAPGHIHRSQLAI